MSCAETRWEQIPNLKNRFFVEKDVAFIEIKTSMSKNAVFTKINIADLGKLQNRPCSISANRAIEGLELFYARVSMGVGNLIALHRLITEAPKGLYVDHINHNTLDNRRHNLRLVTPSENVRNRIKRHTKEWLANAKEERKRAYELFWKLRALYNKEAV